MDDFQMQENDAKQLKQYSDDIQKEWLKATIEPWGFNPRRSNLNRNISIPDGHADTEIFHPRWSELKLIIMKSIELKYPVIV
ncbi:MAG: hypothetical protein OMM_14418, partial [Candidatus Magnetoglobus multicellularis str. Araruama]